MSEPVLHIEGSQVVDVVVRGSQVTVYFLGGVSVDEMESGGTTPEMYDIVLEFGDIDQAINVRGILYGWYAESEPVTVVAYEDGGALMTNENSNFSLRVTCDNDI